MAVDSTQTSNVTPFRGGTRLGGRYTPSQRAAVVIAMLGEAAAKPIIEKLDDAALAKVAVALENISSMAKDELTDIVIDFLSHLRNSNTDFTGSTVEAKGLITGIVEERRTSLSSIDGGGSADEEAAGSSVEPGSVWARLSERPPEKIAEYLNRLTPNLISLIVRKLDVTFSSEVLSLVDEAKLEAVMGYLVEADVPDAGIESIVGRMVEMEFLNAVQEVGEEQDESHLQSVGELLSLIPASRRNSLMEFLKSRHEGKLEGIQKSLFTIDGLPDMLPRNAIPTIFREMEQAETLKLISSLQGAQSSVAEFLLSNISSRMAEQMREELKELAPLSPEEVEIVQRNFLTTLMTMKREGIITLL